MSLRVKIKKIYNREADVINLLIDVKGIDVGHVTDVIYSRHDALLQVVVDVVLIAGVSERKVKRNIHSNF